MRRDKGEAETEITVFERGGGDYQFKMGRLQAGMG